MSLLFELSELDTDDNVNMERLKKTRHARNLEKKASREQEKKSIEQSKSVRKILFTPCNSKATINVQSTGGEEQDEFKNLDKDLEPDIEVEEFEEQLTPLQQRASTSRKITALVPGKENKVQVIETDSMDSEMEIDEIEKQPSQLQQTASISQEAITAIPGNRSKNQTVESDIERELEEFEKQSTPLQQKGA
ncbi:uncharacterized protein LOC127290351 [Leptopilina boulardi]|uniref:uncharacterized protein LOC127290351 n=1 Tax=Leptopilina boulardi TaxID=63433 RepID=UPI0021F5C713|nr:uncharacterized protein LOC127290351 [Leptopilina boulardi]